MNSEISPSTINKLSSEVSEIRLRALKAIEVQFKIFDHLTFNGPFLMKALLKWFDFDPICAEGQVLNLIYIVLKGYQRDDTLCTLGVTELKDKIILIEHQLDNNEHKAVINKILQTVTSHDETKENQTETLTNVSLDEISGISMPSIQTDDLSLQNGAETDQLDYVIAWETPGPSDLNSLNLLKSSLRLDADVTEIMHAIAFLKTAIMDFPAEFFLQPPYIFQSLKNLLSDQQNRLSIELLEIFANMTKALEKRIKMRKLSRTYSWDEPNTSQLLKKNQVSIARYFYELFKTTLAYFKVIIHNIDSGITFQQEFNCCFTVMFSLIDLISNGTGEYHFNEILIDLGYLTKYFRKTWDKSQMDQSNRNVYINTLYILSKTVLLKHESRSQFALTPDIHQVDYCTTVNSLCQFKKPTSASQSDTAVWNQELETALFDFPLKQSYSEVYDTLLRAVQTYNNLDTMTQNLLNCDLILKPAVEVLQESDIQNRDEFISSSMMAIQTLSLHKSYDLIQKIFSTVLETVPLFDGNPSLKNKCEKILLRLIAHDDNQIKKTVYGLCGKNIKSYFSCLMEGSTIITKKFSSNATKTCFLGIPLTTEILNEFICFGLDHLDTTIRSNAETILSLILKSKNMLNTLWKNIFEILSPTLPLLLCYASKRSVLGHSILSMMNPDSDLLTQYLIQGNVILLFNEEYQIRQDAVAALMYLLLDQNDANLYLPNIQNITDVIPNNICIVDNVINPKNKISTALHESQSVLPLIELLEQPNVEPTQRKTSFIQLNLLTQDPKLNQIFHDAGGLYLCLQALQNALKENHSADHHDSAIPTIGIIAKLFLQMPEYRRGFMHDVDIYYLLLRALIIFHQHAGLKTDCAISLFIIAFGEYSIGSYDISLPIICSKLKIPFTCDFHWQNSQFNEKSYLEKLLLDRSEGTLNDIDETNIHRSHMSTKLKTMWQYVRLQFANLWFGGIEHISIDFEYSADRDLSVVYSSENNYPNAMTFDKRLCLTKMDLKLIQASTLSHSLKHWLQTISNATRRSDVIKALAAISNNLLSPGICSKELNVATISSHIMRFYTSPPNSETDESIFIELLKFLENLIRNDYDKFLHWLLQEFKKNNCVFINMLQSSTCSSKCYALNGRFVGIVFDNAIFSENENIRLSLIAELSKGRNDWEKPHILDKVFGIVTQLLDGTFEKGYLDKLRTLVSLLQIITSSELIIIDEECSSHIANKLLHIVSSIKSLAQIGSNLNKNCLLTIGNLMHSSDNYIFIETKYVKFLSGLCGHKDVEIRAFSWMILTLMSRKLKGAESLIEDLSYLPGGLHACCLSTLLDVHDASTVRELAGSVFMNLIKFQDVDQNLHKSVAPRCVERETQFNDNAFDLIIDIIKYQQFFERVSDSLQHFFVHEFINDEDINTHITTCDIVRVYCGIFTNLINLNEGLVELFYENGLVFEIIRLIPLIQMSTNESAILMLKAICTFMFHCFDKDVDILNQIGVKEHAIFMSLVHCLRSDIYDNFSEVLKISTFNSIIPIITLVANTAIGYNLIWNLFTQNEMQPLFKAIIFGLQTKGSNNLTVSVLKLLSSLLTASGKSDTDHFANLFDQMEVDRTKSNEINGNNKLIGKNKTEINNASELIFSFLLELFRSSKGNRKIRTNLCKVIALLLFGSAGTRKMALNIDFFNDILDELESILSKAGMSCGEFVRKYGDQKKDPIVCQMKSLLNILMHWFSKDCCKDEHTIGRLCHIIMLTWSWTGASSHFQLLVIKTLAFLSESSVPVCKAMVTYNLGTSQTVLQILTEQATSETSKPKQLNSNLNLLELTLRTISNCCSCVEGRIQLTKLNVFDTINRLHPTITKQHKPWNSVLYVWLELYEIYTRYPDVNTIKHLHTLCFLAKKASLKLKIVSLTIIRNMAFGSANKPALLASDELLHTLSDQLETGSADVHLLVTTCIWKLIANNYRGKHTIRTTAIPRKIISIRNSIVTTDENSELCYILETLHSIISK